jgi:hypothetical protein
MRKKILGILIMTLLISAIVIPVTATMNEKTGMETKIIISAKEYNTNDFLKEYGKDRIPVELNNINFIPKNNIAAAGPKYEFLKEPVAVFTSYYDYQPGSYCGFPIDKQTQNGDGVYFTFQGQATAKGTRFQYYAYVNSSYNIKSDGIYINTRQGFGTLAIHPATGNAIASWHEDPDGDAAMNNAITYDDFDAAETAGSWKTPKYFDNAASEDYIWPYIYIGPSPEGEGHVRVYIIQSNSINNDAALPCEDVFIYYIDIENTNGIDMKNILNTGNWNSVNVFGDWREKSIRPFQSFAVDQTTPGKVAFIGNAVWLEGDLGDMPVTQGAFVWESLDYGETWSYTNLHTDGPASYLYMVDNVINADFDGTIPEQLSVGIAGEHSTAIYDGDGNLHYAFLADYGHETAEGRYYLPYYMPQMELVWDGSTFTIHEVSKMPGIDPLSGHTVPWIDAENADPVIGWSIYPGASAIFSENAQKQAVNLENGWMAHMWVDGTLAQLAADGNGSAEYFKHPIIYIAISTDNGATWSNPIQLTDVNSEKFDFSEQITVYPYFCDTIKDLGDDWGQIDMYYFDDNQFGSSVQGTGTDKSGQITYCSIKIDFSEGVPPTKPTCTYDKKNNEITVSSTDADGDQIRYGVSWANNQKVDEWTTLYNSGVEASINCEGKNGTVGIIAEDATGRQSGWVSVTPKNKSVGLNSLSELLTILYKLLQRMLQL